MTGGSVWFEPPPPSVPSNLFPAFLFFRVGEWQVGGFVELLASLAAVGPPDDGQEADEAGDGNQGTHLVDVHVIFFLSGVAAGLGRRHGNDFAIGDGAGHIVDHHPTVRLAW